MKPAALALIATILMSTPALSASLGEPRSTEMNITVMSRGEVDPTELRKETYAYVAYKSDGIERAVWGRIVQIKPGGIVIKSDFTPSQARKIAYGDIDILAVAEDRLTLEMWMEARKAAATVTVMSPKELDLSKLSIGSYVNVVYAWKGFKRKESGTILEMAPDGILVESGAEHGEQWKIAAAEIDTIVFAKTSQALERWHRWTKSSIVGMTRWDLNPSMLEEGLFVHVDYTSRGTRREAAGRIVDKYTDRIVIQQRVGGKNSFARRQRLEIAFGNIETVIVSRDRRALTSDLVSSTIVFLHLAH